MKQSHVENTVGPWARQKLDGLEAYLNAYTTALKWQPFELVYIDAFAGAGKSKLRDSWAESGESSAPLLDLDLEAQEEQFIEGSPRRALGIRTPFNRCYFFDADPSRVELLNALKSEYPDRQIEISVGDGNAQIRGLLPNLQRPNIKGVAFLDPYGHHLHWETLRHLGLTKKFEVIVNFPLGMAINRLITKTGEMRESWRSELDLCFGSNEWENLVYADKVDLFGNTVRSKVDDAAQRLLQYYNGRLKGLFGYVAKPSVVRNSQGMPIYYMLWAGPHKLGQKIASHILDQGERISAPKRNTK